ncbi:MAG: sulfite exporter TauE/SafE family protein [bacterium]
MNLLAAAGSGALFGVLHGLGPDHCAALASLIAHDQDHRASTRASFQFGLGHAAALGVLGLAASASGLLIPESWESAAEVFAGLLLLVVGVLALTRRDAQLVIHSHAHDHVHPHAHDEPPHAHWHMHLGTALFRKHDARQPHRHPHLAAIIGGAFGLSGVRALTLALPPLILAAHSLASALVFVVAFGLGVTISMVAFGFVFQTARRGLLSRFAANPAVANLWIARSIGVFAIGLGIYWVARNFTIA